MLLHELCIVTDSSADIISFEGVKTGSAPLKILTAQKEYVDNAALDVSAMMADLASYKGKSSTACPSMADFIDAFGGAKYVFCITISGNLSGSYSMAMNAAREYMEADPSRKVRVVDSLSTGPEMRMIAELIVKLAREGKEFAEVSIAIDEYLKKTELLFLLESLTNLANNGRVSVTVAKIAKILGIRMLGRASDIGTIEPVAKPRGAQKSFDAVLENMLSLGYKGGKVRISHSENENAAKEVEKRIKQKFPSADVIFYPARALCSFYAERGGIIVGFEKD